MAVLTKHFSVAAANLAVLAITNNATPKYIFVSHPLPWLDDNDNWNDNIIPDANISIQQSETNTYNELVFGKLITRNDAIQMVPRYNWNVGTVYAAYSGMDENLFSKNYYVITDDLNVYKCIDNNFGNQSLVKPTVVSTFGTFFTSDGYVWKYMFSIPSDINTKFTTTNFIPVVPNNMVIANAVPGTVDSIDISSFGNGYSAFYSGFLQNAVNGYVVVLDANASPYNNFYVGSSMYLKAGFGAGQLRQIVSYDGLNKLVRFDEPFETFSTLSLANVSGIFNVGDTLLQNIDNLAVVYPQGVFQVGDTVVQSDTGANGIVIGSNTTILQIVRNSSNLFSLTYPIYDTVVSGTVGPGTVSVEYFTDLYTLSNTAAFTNGEFIYQSNGTANVGTGILFGVTVLPSVNTSFEPINTVNVSANFIAIPSNPYANLTEILYTTAVGNTPVFPLTNNTIYYVSFSNSSGIALSSSSGGANLSLALSKTETFNPNTGINGNSFISIAGNFVVNGQAVVYTVSPGNTVPVGLSNGFTYYAVHANSSGLNLSTTYNGPNASITPTTHNETGHTLTFNIPPEVGHYLSFTQEKLIISQVSGLFVNTYQVKGNTSHANAVLQTANLDSSGLAYAFSTNTAQTTFTTTFPGNSYIRIGTDANNNIRRVVSSNTSCVILDTPLAQTAISNLTYTIPNATEIVSYTLLSANGLIVNTNLETVIVSYSNAQTFGTLFIPGERVDLTDNIGTFQGTYGIVSYSNTTSVVIAQVTGSGFVHGFYLKGESSLQFAYINTILSYPTITIQDPLGQFIAGQEVYSRSTADLSIINGFANVVSYFITPGQQTEYVISPTVIISGDGEGALAYATINTSPTVNFPIANVIIINNGTGFTYANVAITSNLSFGNGATALARVSPLLGHGYNPYEELGASYVGISLGIANSVLENYYFPMFGNYRKVGIIDTPLYNDLQVDIEYYDRVKLTINHSTNNFYVGEVVYQPNSSAAGLVVYSNNTYLELKNVIGTFSANGKFANNAAANDNVVGLFSQAIANVSFGVSAFFDVLSDDQLVYQVASETQAVLVDISGENNLHLTNVSGLFSANDMLFDPTSNAYGWVNAMYTANGSTISTYTFGLRFNQTLRIPLTSSSGQFQLYETVTQSDGNTTATGLVIGGFVSVPGQVSSVNIGNDVDISYSNTFGSFPTGSIIYNTGNVGVGTVITSNSSYLRLTAVNGYFSSGDQITSTINATCTVGNVFPAMILNNVDGNWISGVLSGNIVGSNTGTVGRCDTFNVITYPDLVRNSGQVMYFENLAPFSLSNNAQEIVSLIMAF